MYSDVILCADNGLMTSVNQGNYDASVIQRDFILAILCLLL